MLRFADAVRFVRVWCAALAVMAVTATAFAQPAPTPALFDQAKAALEAVEQAIQHEGLGEETLGALKRRLGPLREELRGKIEALEPQLAQAVNRLEQLGERPAPGAAAEDAAVTQERDRLQKERAEVEATLKHGRLLALRADQASERINESRRALFTRELFARTAGVFDLAFWRATVEAAAEEVRDIGGLLDGWWIYVQRNGGAAGIAATVGTLLALALATIFLRRWLHRRLGDNVTATRFGRALAALIILALYAVAPAAVVAAVVTVFDGNGLLPDRVEEVGFGLVVAMAIAGFGRGVAIGLFAPTNPARRLIRCDDTEASVLADHLVWGAGILGAAVFFNLIHKGFSAPISLTVATSALLAVAFGLMALHLLLRFPKPADAIEGQSTRLAWLRILAWVFVAALSISLVTGYIGFAAFLAGRLLVVLAMLGALYIAIAFVDALFSEALTGETSTGHALAGMLGISTRTLELVGTLLSAMIRVVLVALAFVPVLGQWGIFAADVFGVLQDAASGVRIGGITISITTILGAVAIFLIGILATRAAQRWLERRFLPRTGLELGLQHSVSALFGYALFIAVLSLTLAQIGIDLQKIALVAGALSVGIGFGLQSVVSNFVSGLILLAERPIRVGDWVVVKNEEGWVRRISVRATEIETFDRATVIVPNSEFITGVVKNWTHSNTMGRITIKVGVAYDTDVERARELLMTCAQDHAQVLQTPPPRVFLLGFGDCALDFELRCIVANVENALSVKSDLYFAVLACFRSAGIAIPFPQREVRLIGDGDTAGGEAQAGGRA